MAASSFARVWARFAEAGLMLRADARLPSVATMVAGGPIAGSWWSHPLAHPIYDVCQELAHHPDVLIVKLVGGKVTYLHRRLWAPLLAVGTSGAPWQRRGLSAPARALARRVAARETLRLDELRPGRAAPRGAVGAAARELETRLAVYSEDVHTDRGAHTKRLESWRHWSGRAGPVGALSAEAGEVELERAVRSYAGDAWRASLVPWAAARARPRSRR
jgi:hypothetical protein